MQGGMKVTMFKLGTTEHVTTEVTEQVERLVNILSAEDCTSTEIQ